MAREKFSKSIYKTYKLINDDFSFTPNWMRNENPDTGKKFTCSEEGMLYAIKKCLKCGALIVWNKKVFTP